MNRTVSVTTFLATVIEAIEMVAIVVAVASTRSWRAALAGARGGLTVFSGDDVIRWRSDSRHTAPTRGVRVARPAGRLQLVPLPPMSSLSSFSTAQLCWLWRISGVRLQERTFRSEAERLARLRERCLVELHQRDPEAFRRWVMTARAADDPAPFFRSRLEPGVA